MLYPGNVSSLGDASPITQPRTINVVLFGETGVGKSSVINLIARRDLAKVSSDVNGCTMLSTRYDISFDDMNFAIFDTIGLEEPQMGVNGYLKAIEKAYELIAKLGAAGGIHLLLFCMRGGRITATTQSNYRLFCECLCNTKVPTALVFTGLEREVEMEDWWTRNKTHIEHYGIKSDGHACITAVQDDTPGEDLKFTESQKRIRELLKSCALKNEAFLPEPHTWFAKLAKGMRSFIEKHRSPRRRDVMKVLTHRCKLDPETARKIAEMMEKGDEQAGNVEGEGKSNPEVRTDGNDETEVAKENAAKDGIPSNQLGDVKAEPRIVEKEEKDESVVAKKTLAKDYAPPNQLGDIKAEPRHIVEKEGKDESAVAKRNVAKDDVLPNQPSDAKAQPRMSAMREKDQRKVAKKNAAKDDALLNRHGDFGAEPRIGGGKNGGQHKKHGSPGGDQPPGAGVVEHPKQSDTKKKPNPSVSSLPRQVFVSQS